MQWKNFTYVKLLIGVFGHKLLEEKIEIVKRTPEQSSISLQSQKNQPIEAFISNFS